MPIPFIDLKAQYARIKPDIDRRIAAVLEHGAYILGPEVRELEAALAGFCGARHGIAVASGTDALQIALMAEGIGTGDAVFLPGFTFTATAEVVVLLGATPVFVDVHPRRFTMDPGDLDAAVARTLKAGKLRPAAVIAVDLFGQTADYGALSVIAERHGMFLLADAAQSFGGMMQNRPVGTLAPTTATSFYPAKPLGGYGDGGALFTDSDERAALMRSIRVHGQGEDRYEDVRVGVNGRMDTLQAAILLAKLSIFPEEIAAREAVARRYDARLAKAGIAVPERVPGCASAWAQYSILIDRRDAVAAALKERGIPTMIYYPRPVHLQPAYRAYGDGDGALPVSEALCRRILALPMHPYLTAEDQEMIADAVIAEAGRAS